MKHQVVASGNFNFFKTLQTGISYRYVERPTNSYNVVDASVRATVKGFTFSVIGNNIFNASFVEKANVPMPKGNVLFGIKYRFQ